MKAKIFLLIAGATIVTLSFTFATSSHKTKEVNTTTTEQTSDAPAGGFALEDEK